MPASMMSPAVGPILIVNGRISAIAPAGPSPGSTPTMVPSTVPTKQAIRFTGSRATSRAEPKSKVTARALSEETRRQRHTQPLHEHHPGADRDAERQHGRPQPAGG